jgi:hypothetical protein
MFFLIHRNTRVIPKPMSEFHGFAIVRKNQLTRMPVWRDEGSQNRVMPILIALTTADFQRSYRGRHIVGTNDFHIRLVVDIAHETDDLLGFLVISAAAIDMTLLVEHPHPSF